MSSQQKEQTVNKDSIIANLSSQINVLSKTTQALHLTAEQHNTVADHIRAVSLLMTQFLQANDAMIEKVKAQMIEKDREIAELKKIKNKG